jgi:hypothetical protein
VRQTKAALFGGEERRGEEKKGTSAFGWLDSGLLVT